MNHSRSNLGYVPSVDQLVTLLRFLERHVPSSIPVISTLKQWLKYPDLNYTILCIEGKDRDPAGILVFHTFHEEAALAVVWACDNQLDIFQQGLERLSCCNTMNIEFQDLYPNCIPSLRKMCSRRRIPNEIYGTSDCYILPLEEALTLDDTCPVGTYLKSLDVEDCKIVYDTWKYSPHYPYELTAEDIRRFPSAGLYRQQDGQLMSWITTYTFGSLGRLFTREEFRGRGYATIVIGFLCKQMAHDGQLSHVFIEQDNQVSRRMFSTLGFQFQFVANWMRCSKPIYVDDI